MALRVPAVSVRLEVTWVSVDGWRLHLFCGAGDKIISALSGFFSHVRDMIEWSINDGPPCQKLSEHRSTPVRIQVLGVNIHSVF